MLWIVVRSAFLKGVETPALSHMTTRHPNLTVYQLPVKHTHTHTPTKQIVTFEANVRECKGV